jgi:hypothetical protein
MATTLELSCITLLLSAILGREVHLDTVFEQWLERKSEFDAKRQLIEARFENNRKHFFLRRFIVPKVGIVVEVSDSQESIAPTAESRFKVKRHISNQRNGIAFSVSRAEGGRFSLEGGARDSSDPAYESILNVMRELSRNFTLDCAPFGANVDLLGSTEKVVAEVGEGPNGKLLVRFQFHSDVDCFAKGNTLEVVCDPLFKNRIIKAKWQYDGGIDSYECSYLANRLDSVFFEYTGQPPDKISFRELAEDSINDKQFYLEFYGIPETAIIKRRRLWPVIVAVFIVFGCLGIARRYFFARA